MRHKESNDPRSWMLVSNGSFIALDLWNLFSDVGTTYVLQLYTMSFHQQITWFYKIKEPFISSFRIQWLVTYFPLLIPIENGWHTSDLVMSNGPATGITAKTIKHGWGCGWKDSEPHLKHILHSLLEVCIHT